MEKRLLLSFPLKHREDLDHSSKLTPDEDREVLYAFLHDKTMQKLKEGSALMVPFPIEDFKVGTLDSLVLVGEDLVKIDQTFETILDRLHGHLRNLSQCFPDEPNKDNTPISVLIDDLDPEEYLQTFQWNSMKYRADQPVKDIADMLMGEVSQADNLVKAKMNAFYQSKSELDSVNKSKTGSLMIKDLSDLLDGVDLVAGSEFMQTLAVIVPKQLKEVWNTNYQTYAEYVVPGSSRFITEDADNALFVVTIFNKVRAEFQKNCSANKFTVRDVPKTVDVDSDDVPTGIKSPSSIANMEGSLRAQWSNLFRLVRSNLGEAYAAYFHLKALRLFVESVLRYGLPAQYLTIYVRLSDEKSTNLFEKKLLQALENLKLPGISLVELATAMHAAGISKASTGDAEMDNEEQEIWTALNMSSKDFEPFVKIAFKISLGTRGLLGFMHETVSNNPGLIPESHRILLGDRDDLVSALFAERLANRIVKNGGAGVNKVITSLSVPEELLMSKDTADSIIDWTLSCISGSE